MASIFNISVLAQTLLRLFLSLCLSFSPKLSQSLSRSLLDHPESCLCVLQLFPCCGLSLCYFVSAWLRLRNPPTHARTPCSLHTSTHLNPPLYCSAPHLFPFPCSCPKRIGEGWLLYQVQVSWVGEKGRRGYGCLPSGGEFIQPGIPHLWQVLTHMSQPVIHCKKKPLWLNAIIKAIILCVATYTQETWQCCRAACSSWAIHG